MKKLMILILLAICLTACEEKNNMIEEDNKNNIKEEEKNVIEDLYDIYNSKIEEAVSKTKVPVATKDLSNGKMVWNEDVDFKNIKIDDAPNGIVTNINNLVGLCLKENVIIKNGEYFYETDLEECSNIE